MASVTKFTVIGLLFSALICHPTEVTGQTEDSDLSTACGWNTTALNGTVQSPNFPANYSNNQSCVYIITAPAGYQITLNFTDMDIEPSASCLSDFIEIRAGNETSPRIGQYCGTSVSSPKRTFGNQMWIKFVSDSSTTGKGFRATFVSDNLQAPFFLISAPYYGSTSYRAIVQMDVETLTNYAVPLPIMPTWPVAIDFDPVEQTIYWTEVSTYKGIRASPIDGSSVLTVLQINDSSILGLAVDPLSRLIFYTDRGRDLIAMMTMSTFSHKTIINSSLEYPVTIVLDTADGVMFWTDRGNTPKIERANYDGSDRKTLVNTTLQWPNSLALDVAHNRIYWVDAGTDRVEMSDMEGNGRSVLLAVSSSPHDFVGLALLNNTLYITDWSTGRLLRLEIGSPNYTIMDYGRTSTHLSFIHVVQPHLYSTIGVNGCGNNNGGCDAMCIPLPSNSSKCACPDGQVLTSNQSSCVFGCPANQWGVNCSQICNCSDQGTCDGVKGCVCDSGWSGINCSIDINECATLANACPENQTCQNHPGSFSCFCPSGFLKANNSQCIACPANQWGVNCSQICNCSDQGTCDRVKGCVCDSGWSGINCSIDINECATLANACPEKQTCQNHPGSFSCHCPSGFLKVNNSQCIACPAFQWGVNCSQTCNCSDHGTCDGVKGCVCDSGWSGINCSIDIDECATLANACPENQTCQNHPGSFRCHCPSGFLKMNNSQCIACPANQWGVNCSQTCNCSDHGTCDRVKGCVCDNGWSEVNCSIDIDECATLANACPENQTCQNHPGSFSCHCPSGFLKVNNSQCIGCPANQWGVNCSQTCNCSDQGTCDRVKGCVCDSGWSGINCSIDINECATLANACPEKQTCQNHPGSFSCHCPSGFLKVNNSQCIACPAFQWGVNCSQTCNCSDHGTCDGVKGCVCDSGWSGINCSIDINECATLANACPENQTCQNHPGSFSCHCPSGFLKMNNSQCIACPANQWGVNCSQTCNGSDHGTCDRVKGCVCDNGWSEVNCSIDIDECATLANACPENQTCQNHPGSFSCHCPSGFLKVNNSQCIGCPANQWGVNCSQTCNCSDHGTCDRVKGCVCDSGWSGINCSIDIECETLANACPEKQTCQNHPGSFSCHCPSGFLKVNNSQCIACPANQWGVNCSQTCNCSDHGTCDRVKGCVCDNGWSGVNCSIDIDECETLANACPEKQTCQNHPGSFSCHCPSGFLKVNNSQCIGCPANQWGVNCSQTCNCSDHGTCDRVKGCVCDNGWSGVNCSIDIDECATLANACPENQTCQNHPGSFSCHCPSGFLKVNNSQCIACPANQWGVNCSQTCNCSDQGTCDRVKGCLCDSGWSGVNCSIDIDECATLANACPENQTCQNHPGSFSCHCPSGFLKVNNSQCIDIDECAMASKNTCHQVCTNTPGSYVCSCHDGYAFDAVKKTCIDYTQFLGFGKQQGDKPLAKGQQKLSEEVRVPNGLPIAGKIVTKAFVSMKGLISFGEKYDSFSPKSLPVKDFDLMCGYWTDLQLPENDDTANVWYQVYSRNEYSTAKDLDMLSKGGKRVEQYASFSSYMPVFMLVVTFDNVPPNDASTKIKERVNFQMVVVSDGFTTYSIITYAAGGIQLDSTLRRLITIGALSKNIDITSPDAINGNTGQRGVWFLTLSTWVLNFDQSCLNWYLEERPKVSQNTEAQLSLPACPCVLWLVNIVTALISEDPNDDTVCFLTAATSFETQYTQRCCYSLSTGSFVQTRPLAGSFLLYHPSKNPSGHFLKDTLPKQHCCLQSQLCDKYYEVRPISTCEHVNIIQSMGAGDPHITTLDGKLFSFNAVGEFILLGFQQPRFELQARTCVATSGEGKPVAASVFCAFSAKGDNSSFQVEMNQNKTGLNVIVDRQDLSRKFQTEAVFRHTFSGLSVDRPQDNAIKAFFTEGIGVTVNLTHRQLTIHISVYLNTTGLQPTGLLGNMNGNPEDDFIFPNGTTLPGNTSEQDLLTYGKTWAITDDNSLFVYGGGWGTSHYTDDNFQPLFLSNVTDQTLAEAQTECGDTKDFTCIYDFIATKDKALAVGTKSANNQLRVNIKNADNKAPTLAGPARIEVILGQSTSITFAAKDEDDVNVPKYVMIQLPSTGFTFNETTQTAQYTPGSNNVSSIEVGVVDNKGVMSPSLRIPIVQCSSCSNHGTCNFTTLRPTGDEYFQWATCDCQPYYSGDDCEADLDACADDPCPLQTTCTDLSVQEHMAAGLSSPGYRCSGCPDGYLWRLVAAVITCQDIDECRSNPPPSCQQLCTNTLGSFQCSCKPGYRKDSANSSLCMDIDECQENTHGCQHQCVNAEGSYQCRCFPGFTLNTTDAHTCVRETGADPCAALSPPCAYACKNESGVIQCLCPSGYALGDDQRTCKDINECELNQCSQKCNNTDGSYACSCYIGFQLGADKITCNACPANQWGDNCNQTCDCRGRGTCNGVRGCICDSGWSGVTCSIDVNECETMVNLCPDNQICQNNPGSFTCVCPSGFLKVNNTLCIDIDECAVAANNTCQHVCTNTPGSYVCSCRDGYMYNASTNTCDDIDECAVDTDRCEYQCENFPGTANCICGVGFILNDDRRTCTKEEDPCKMLANSKNCSYACQVVNGSAQCYCADGYQLAADGETCADVDECSGSHRCDQGCENIPGNYRCTCSTGYKLANDQRTCAVCDGNHWGDGCNKTCDCSPVGTHRCDRGTGCVCHSGWQGLHCQMDRNECLRNPCANLSNAQCVNTAGSFRCQCRDGYGMNTAGDACDDINECLQQQPSPCDQQCNNTEGSYSCSCVAGFYSNGSTCVDIDECQGNPCDQLCRNTFGGYFCECRAGYLLNATTRNTCYDKDECLTSPCDQTCRNTIGSYVCECQAGYVLNTTTRNTCQDINECVSSPCIRGSCVNTPGNFTCSCPPGSHLSSDLITCQACDDVHYGNECASQCACARVNTAECNDVSGACTCKPGWTGENCTEDVDECSLSTNRCEAAKQETCRNTQGGYSCDCITGYVRDSSGQECVGNTTDSALAMNTIITGSVGAAMFVIPLTVVIVYIVIKRRQRKSDYEVPSERKSRSKDHVYSDQRSSRPQHTAGQGRAKHYKPSSTRQNERDKHGALASPRWLPPVGQGHPSAGQSHRYVQDEGSEERHFSASSVFGYWRPVLGPDRTKYPGDRSFHTQPFDDHRYGHPVSSPHHFHHLPPNVRTSR